jgi:serine/threonine protein kinase
MWASTRGSDLAEDAMIGRYRILRQLGGGLSTVYLARDTQLGRDVALKIPRFAVGESPAVVQRFYREARALATLMHPNICPVYDVGQAAGVHFLAMSYVEGRPLSELVTVSPLPQRQVAEIVRTLARALAKAHALGIIHRDLKPSNVLISRYREPVILDFGLTRPTAHDPHLAKTGSPMDTGAYMSPEQARGVGPACDIYSLGVIQYELLTGRPPFEGPPAVDLGQVLRVDPPPPSALRSGLDPRLEAICLKAMAKRVEDRYASMTELAVTLDEYLRATEPVKPAPEVGGGQLGQSPGLPGQQKSAEPTPSYDKSGSLRTDLGQADPSDAPHAGARESEPNSDGIPWLGRSWLYFDRYQDAAPLVFYSGLVGAGLFAYLAIGPAWIGFLAGYLPMSMLMALAYASHG